MLVCMIAPAVVTAHLVDVGAVAADSLHLNWPGTWFATHEPGRSRFEHTSVTADYMGAQWYVLLTTCIGRCYMDAHIVSCMRAAYDLYTL